MDYTFVGSLDNSFSVVSADMMSFVPSLVTALLILIAGWVIAGMLKGVVINVFKKLKVNEALDAAEVDKLAERAGYKLDAGSFVGGMVKWFVILVFFVAALDILGLDQVTYFVRDVVLGYLPKVIVAVLILLVAMIVANVASKSVVAAVRASGVEKPDIFGKMTYYAVVVFAVLAALNQLEIAPELVQTLFMGITFAVSLALGLSFGLGGRDAAGKYINKMTSGGGHHGGHHNHH